MQTAYLYIRVSTDEQAAKGYSLRCQKEALLKFCELKMIQVDKIISEDFSAKDFKRPGWCELTKELNHLKREQRPTWILFTKWDRFSRNVASAYYMFEMLKKMGIETLAIEQPLDLTVPENKIILAVYLATSEVENERRSLNVKAGMRKASEEGRWMGQAPIGYKNILDQNGIKKIIPHSPASDIIKLIFRLALKDSMSIRALHKQAQNLGLKSSLSNFWRLIKNPVYCGKIVLKKEGFKDGYLINGQHDAIISESLFEQVQLKLTHNKKTHIKKCNDDFLPLRGAFRCPICHKVLTGSASKGRSKHYHYYHCKSPCNFRIRAGYINELFFENLKSFATSTSYKSLYEEILRTKYKQLFGESITYQFCITNVLEHLLDRLTKARELLRNGNIDRDDYLAIKSKCEEEMSNMGNVLENTTLKQIMVDKDVHRAVQNLSNLANVYESVNKNQKRKFISLVIFNEKIEYTNGKLLFYLKGAVGLIYQLNYTKKSTDSYDWYPVESSILRTIDPDIIEEIIKVEHNLGHTITSETASEIAKLMFDFVNLILEI